MNKKFIALSMVVLVMALHAVTAYAYDIPNVTMYNNITQRTENGVTGKIETGSNDPNYQTYHVVTSTAPRTTGYLSAQIFLEDALTNANIATNKAYAGGMDEVRTRASATYGYYTQVRVTGIYQAGTSENNITTSFGMRKIYTQ